MATNRSLAATFSLYLNSDYSNISNYDLRNNVMCISSFPNVRTLLDNYRGNVALSITGGHFFVANGTGSSRSAQATISLGGTQVYNGNVTVRGNDSNSYTLGSLAPVTSISNYMVTLNLSDSQLHWDGGSLTIYLTMTFPWPTKGDKISSSSFSNLGIEVTKTNVPLLYRGDTYSWRCMPYYQTGSFGNVNNTCSIDYLNTPLRDKIQIV